MIPTPYYPLSRRHLYVVCESDRIGDFPFLLLERSAGFDGMSKDLSFRERVNLKPRVKYMYVATM